MKAKQSKSGASSSSSSSSSILQSVSHTQGRGYFLSFVYVLVPAAAEGSEGRQRSEKRETSLISTKCNSFPLANVCSCVCVLQFLAEKSKNSEKSRGARNFFLVSLVTHTCLLCYQNRLFTPHSTSIPSVSTVHPNV